MVTAADRGAECLVICTQSVIGSRFSYFILPRLHPAITHAEWRVVPTGEAGQRWTGLAVDEALRVCPSDGADWWETFRLPWGRNESRHPARGFLKGGGRRLGLLRFDCGHQYLGRRGIRPSTLTTRSMMC